ncbi:uncharacterized protein METZ01_LOCUS396131, partial [marine metagenome]
MKAVMLGLALALVLSCGEFKEGFGKGLERQKKAAETTKTQPLKTADQKPGTVIWEFETGGGVFSSPAFGSDGTVYIGSNDLKLYAINGRSGIKIWVFELGGEFTAPSTPAVGADGTVYVGSDDKKLYAINP